MNSSLHIGNTPLSGANRNSASLKRTRPSGLISRKFDPSRAPSLPQLNVDLLLQVFTHRSLRRPDVSPTEYGDNEKLSQLGQSVLEMEITHILFSKRPLIHVPELSKCRQHLLSCGMIEDWVAFYGLVSKVRCHLDVLPALTSTKEIHHLFYAYVGAVYAFSGPLVLNGWLSTLLGQELEIYWDHIDIIDSPQIHFTPPSKRIKSEYESPPIPNGPHVYPLQPPAYPQHNTVELIATPKPHFVPNPMAPAQPTLPFLPLFNQAAMQRRVNVEYQADFSGPSHAGRWAVKCIVNGFCKGEGTGNSKQAAKEEAARNAYYSMGWT